MKKIGFLHNLKNISRLSSDTADYFKELLHEHDGLLEMNTPSGPVILTDRPGLMKHVFQKNYRNYTKTDVVKKSLTRHMGNGLITMDGADWLKQRRAIQPGFHKQKLQAISEKMVEVIQEYVSKDLERLSRSGEIIDIEQEMMRLAFNIVGRSLLGEMVTEEELGFINEASIISQEMISNRMPLSELWYSISGKNAGADKRRGEIDKILMRIINERRASGVDSDDLLDLLLNTRYEDGSPMPDRQIMDEAKIFYAAGHETSALALTWTFYLLAEHPEINNRLYESLKSSLGDEVPSFERLSELSYAQQILEESMRLYPPAWILGRRSIAEDEFEDVKIPAHTDVLFVTYSMHRSPKYWEEPNAFRPERFTSENKKGHTDSAYVPFGLGPRLCIGKGFAMMEMEFVLAMISSRFRFELVEDDEMELEPLVTLKPKNGVKVRVVKR